MKARRTYRYNPLCIAALVSVVTLVIYMPALRNGFLNWDDDLYVYDNPHIRSLNWTFFRWAFSDLSAGFWHPVTWISYATDYALWGMNPLGYHLTAILLHAINTFLVVYLIIRLLEAANFPGPLHNITPQLLKTPAVGSAHALKGRGCYDSIGGGVSVFPDERGILISAAVTGLLFGLHPLHVESVAWVSERKDLLCAMFFLLSIIAYTVYVKTISLSFPLTGNLSSQRNPGQAGITKSSRQPSARYYLFSFAFFILALASKTMAVSLPVVLMILDWYPLGRIQSKRNIIDSFIEKIPFIAGSLLISLISFTAQKTTGALVLMDVTPLSVRVLVAFRSLMMYLWKMVIPIHLIPFYPYPQNVSVLSVEYFSAVALISGITATSIFYARKQHWCLSLWAYYMITLLPVLGLVQVGMHSMADRFTYLPSLGPFTLLGLGAAWVWTKADLPKKQGQLTGLFTFAITFILVISVSFLTLKQIAIWKSSIDFWNYVIEKEPRRIPTAYLNRGLAYGDKREFDLAIKDYDTALTINSRYSEAYLNRGMAFVAKGQFDRALEDYNAAIAVKPGYIDAYNNRGSLFNRKGQFDRAIEDLNAAITMNPSYFAAYINRGIAYKEKGELDRAIEDYNKAVYLNPDFVKAYVGRGDLYMKKGNIVFAVKDFQKACDLGSEIGCRKALFPFERQ